jgi:hypothetical protein
MTSKGADNTLQSKFNLKEVSGMCSVIVPTNVGTLAQMYVRRSQRNVDDSDGTIAFRLKPSTGTDKTIGYCLTKKCQSCQRYVGDLPNTNPAVINNLGDDQLEKNVEAIRSFIARNKIVTLNIAGHRDDASLGLSQFQQLVTQLLGEALKVYG